MENQSNNNFIKNVPLRNRISVVIGLIIAAILKKYLQITILTETGSVIETVIDVFLSTAMILTVFMLYPFFTKTKNS